MKTRIQTQFGIYLFVMIGALTVGCGVTQAPSSPSGFPPAVRALDINLAIANAAQKFPKMSSDYRLGPEDVLEITVYNIGDADAKLTPRTMKLRVSQQGIINIPLVGDVTVSGLTLTALEQVLRAKYDRYIHNPQVGIYVLENRSNRVSVIGAVRQPGIVDVTGSQTLIDVLAQVGGIQDSAGTQVHIYRKNQDKRESHIVDLVTLVNGTGTLDPEALSLLNMPLQAGDVVNVPQAGTFFVDGAIRSPGSFPLSSRYTLTQALTVAGGLNRELADTTDINIYRRRNGAQAERFSVSWADIMDGKAPDPHIAADDVDRKSVV